MAIRTTEEKVRDILGAQYDNTSSLLGFIQTANSLVDYVVTKDTDGVLASTNLELIERWLSAHFYGHADQFRQSEGAGGASGSYQGQTAMVFLSTQYGATALALDFTGELAKLQKQAQEGKRTAGIAWLGTRYENDNSERTSDQ